MANSKAQSDAADNDAAPLQHNTELIWKFVKKYRTQGWFTLGAVHPAKSKPKLDGKTGKPVLDKAGVPVTLNLTSGCSFDISKITKRQLEDIIKGWAGWNIYFCPNETARGWNGTKPKVEDMTLIHAVWVDVDFDKTKPLPDEQLRIDGIAQEMLLDPDLPPTFMVDTGGGVQAFWLLDRPHDAQLGKVMFTGIGATIRDAFGGDDCQSIDHWMRLPGSVNTPAGRKAATGRVPTMVQLRKWPGAETAWSERRYTSEQLAAKFPPAASGSRKKATAADVEDINWKAVESASEYDDLEDDVKAAFAAACYRFYDLGRRFNGDSSEMKDPADGSEWEWELLLPMAKAGMTATQCGQIIRCCEYVQTKIDQYQRPKSAKALADGYERAKTWKVEPRESPEWVFTDNIEFFPIFDILKEAIAKLTKGGGGVDEMLHRIARAGLTWEEELILLEEIKTYARIGLTELKQKFKNVKKSCSGMGATSDLSMFVGNATLAEHYDGGKNLIWAIDDSFWAFRGTHWTRTTNAQVSRRILDTIHSLGDKLGDAEWSRLVSQGRALLSAKLAADGDVLRLCDEPLPVVNCLDGEIWLNADGTHEKRPHRRESFLIHCLDVTYDPAAICPKFDKALVEIFANERDGFAADPEGMARHFCEFMGYAIQPKRDVATFWVLEGGGSNGKSKLMETIIRLMGQETVMSLPITNAFKNDFAVKAQAGKLLLVDDDIESGTVLPDGCLKRASENKTTTGEDKNGSHSSFTSTILPVMLANGFPRTKDLSYGIRRRAMIIPFYRRFEDAEANPKLFEEIWQEEMSGILNRALEGLARFRARGRFLQPDTCLRARNRFWATANPVAAFADQCCTPQAGGYVLLDKAYDAFKTWAFGEGIKIPQRKSDFSALVEGLGYGSFRRKEGMAISGLVLTGVENVDPGEFNV